MLACFRPQFDNISKKVVLFILIGIEVIVGSVILYTYYTTHIKQSKILGLETTIDKKTLVYPSDSEYKYYFDFAPNEKVTATLPWDTASTVTYNHNGDGLNDVSDYPIEKEEDTFRIVTLGDSFTYGQFVNTEENWTEILEVSLNAINAECENKKYEKYEVINLGAPGFDIPYIVKRYIEKGKKYNSDLVVWFESGTGFSRFNELRGAEQIPCNQPYECEAQKRKYIKENYSSEILDNYLKGKFDLFFSQVSQQNVVYFSQSEPFSDDLATTQQKIDQITHWQSTFPQATMSNVITTLQKDASFIDGHPNQLGHQKLANAIFGQIVTRLGNVCTSTKNNEQQ